MPRWLLSLFLLLVAPVAFGEDEAEEATPEPEKTAFEKYDAAFGTWVVGPLGTVLFWDVWFWDNNLAPGEGIGTLLPGDDSNPDRKILGWNEAKGYELHAFSEVNVDDVAVLLPEPRAQKGEVLSWVLEQDDQGFWGVLADQEIAEPTQLSPPFEEAVEGQAIAEFTADGLVPFPVKVIRTEAEDGVVSWATTATRHHLKNHTLPIAVDAKVRTPDLAAHTVTALSQDGEKLSLLADTSSFEQMVLPNAKQIGMPIVVLWLVFGACFFTLRMNFINLRGFAHALVVTRGDYDNADDPGEISHFQALSSALSATVGLGNIAGVAIAVQMGGPGAIFWMVIAGFLGMSSKFTECTLGQMYRQVDAKGQISGGPMRYLGDGLSEMGMGGLGKVLAVVFAVMCIGGSLGGGNMFQANQSFAQVEQVVPLFEGRGWLYGLLLASMVGVVILGGIKRIGKAAGVIVPVMCGVYVLAAVWILMVNASAVPAAFGTIISEAFAPTAVAGGFVGVLVQGFRRAAFSNEAGIGSASIAHSAAATDEPVREGIVALLEPFIDTVVVCTMTGLVVVITGAYLDKDVGDGVLLTANAFSSVISWFPLILSFAVVMFAFSTMISWSYYGERCATFLFGPAASIPYKIIFLIFVFLGSIFELGNVLEFSDLMILGMAFPNILGLLLLSGKVRAALDDYWGRLKSGEMKRVS